MDVNTFLHKVKYITHTVTYNLKFPSVSAWVFSCVFCLFYRWRFHLYVPFTQVIYVVEKLVHSVFVVIKRR